MCIAALVKPGAVLPDEVFHRMFSTNRDGAGLGYVKTVDGKPVVQIAKGFFDSQDWLEAYKRARTDADPDSPIILHARIATLGKVSRENCHPFRIKDGALIHNGMLWTGWGRETEKSDTREFAERLHNALTYDDIVEDIANIEKATGYNKIVLLYTDKRYIILNEKAGVWKDNVWYSNQHFANANPIRCTSHNSLSTSYANDRYNRSRT